MFWVWEPPPPPPPTGLQSRLTRDAWTICKGFGGSQRMLLRKKTWNLRSSNCWKCIEIVNHTITMLFLYNFKYFTIPSGGPFWLLGGRTPLPTGLLLLYRKSGINKSINKILAENSNANEMKRKVSRGETSEEMLEHGWINRISCFFHKNFHRKRTKHQKLVWLSNSCPKTYCQGNYFVQISALVYASL